MNLRFSALLSLLLIVPVWLPAREKKPISPEPVCTLSFVVLRDSDGAPIKNASVVIHALDKGGNQEKEGIQLKTDSDGKAFIDGVSYSKVRVQVIARHLQTYGDDVEINQPKQEFVIRLKPPVGQLSIYK